MDLENRKVVLLNQLLPLIAKTGWSLEALELACEQAGESFAELFSFKAKPVDEMLKVYSDYLDREMLKVSQEESFKDSRIRDQIATLVMARLKAIEPFKDAGHKTLTYLAMPQNLLLANQLKYRTVNEMWYAAGDKATDYNYYTKRALLAVVYSATLLYWFKDRSLNSDETRRFLYRRLDNVMNFSKIKAAFKRILPF